MLNITNMVKRFGVLAAFGLMLLPGTSVALVEKTIDSKPPDFTPVNVRMGSFVLKPGAELLYEHDDNIYSLNTLEVSDSIMHALLWANLESDWSRHALNFHFKADIARYQDFRDENYEDWMLGLDGRIDVKRDSNFNYLASYLDTHEPRSSPDDVGGVTPTHFTVGAFNVGYLHTFNRLSAALNYDRADTDYDNNVDGDGNILLQDDRDRTRDEVILRFDYELSGQRGIFFAAKMNNLDYKQKVDNRGFERSSDGYVYQGGFTWDRTGVLVGDLFLQYLKQDTDDPRLLEISGFGIGASLDWTPTDLTSVNLLVSHTPQVTTQSDSSGYFSSVYAINLEHKLRRNWLVNAKFSYTDNDYEVSGDFVDALTNTEVIRAGAYLSYLFNRNVYASGGYVYTDQSANEEVFEFKTNRWFVTVGFAF